MSFDFMKNLMFWEDEERFVKLCDALEDAINEARNESGDKKISELEIMQALDHVGFSLFRASWEEFKNMDFNRDLGTFSSNQRNRNSNLH